MTSNNDIRDFAIKYHNFYMDPGTTEQQVRDSFAEECFYLGIRMNLGEQFQEKYGAGALSSADTLNDIIDDVEEPDLLGAAILSYWWNILSLPEGTKGSGLLEPENRKWFILAFSRLAIITDEEGKNPFVFEGRPEKFCLISHKSSLGPVPAPDTEVEQRLYVSSNGNICLERYSLGMMYDGSERIRSEQISSDLVTVEAVLNSVAGAFTEYTLDFVTNVGTWYLTLVNTEGRTFRINGPLYPDSVFHGLSDFLRCRISRNDLFLFDGNPDRVEKIVIAYDRNTKIRSAVPVNARQPYIEWEYREVLIIDRESDNIEYLRLISNEYEISHKYHMPEAVSQFLDQTDINAFSRVEGNPPDVYIDPLETMHYRITITTKLGGDRETEGTFDKKGLPDDWGKFADRLWEFFSFYGIGELLDEHFYGKIRRRNNDLIFCNVTFAEGGKEYCYLSDEDYEPGEFVIVPAGSDNRQKVVRIESVEYHPANEAPYPLNRIKHIIRRFNKNTDMDLLD